MLQVFRGKSKAHTISHTHTLLSHDNLSAAIVKQFRRILMEKRNDLFFHRHRLIVATFLHFIMFMLMLMCPGIGGFILPINLVFYIYIFQ